MSGVVKTVAQVVGVVAAVALAIPSGGASLAVAAGAGLGLSAAASTVIAIGLAVGSSLLVGKPQAPETSPASADRLQANIDPKTPRKIVFGRTAMATDIRDQEFTDSQSLLHRFIVNASHKTGGVEEIWFDDKLAWTAAGGIQGDFVGYLGVENYVEGSAGNAKNISARMGSTRRYTGLSWTYFRYKLTGNGKNAESPFAQSVPTRVTIIGKGALIYDPRLDGTVPGGSGPMRADDRTTWAWDENAARNPALQLLWYLLGWTIRNPVTGEWKLAVGKGMPAARIDLASFITAANLCDEPVVLALGGTQPRYRSDGVFSEGDATGTVLDQLKAAMNAELDDVDGRIRITVLHNDLADFTDLGTDDVIGAFKWVQTPPLDQTFSIVRGTYIDPSDNSLFQAVDYPEVAIPSPDGIDRVETVNFQTVQNASQAQRLVKQRIARMLYSGTFSATFSHRAWKVQKNDIVRLSFSPLGWTNRLFRVAETAVQVDGQVPMVLQVEHPDIYLWDADERPAIQPVEPTTYDPLLNPVIRDVLNPSYSDGTPIDNERPSNPSSPIGNAGMTIGQFLSLQAQAQSDIAALDVAAADLIARIGAAEGEIVTVSSLVQSQGASIAANSTAITNINGSMATLSTTVNTLGSTVAVQVQAVSDLQTTYASLSSTVSSLGGQVSSFASAISDNASNLASLTTKVSASAPNLLKYGSFPNGLGGWTPNGPWGASPAVDPNWGSYVYVSGTGGNYYLPSPPQPVQPNQQYTISADIDRGGTTGGNVAVRIIFLDASVNVVGLISAPKLSGQFSNDSRNRVRATGAAPANATSFYVDCCVEGGTAGNNHFRQIKANVGSEMGFFTDDASIAQSFISLSTLSSQYSSLSSTVSVQGVTVSQQATAINAINSGLAGTWQAMVDVNGRVSGIKNFNNGATSSLRFISEETTFESSSGGARTTYANGAWKVYDSAGNLRVQIGNLDA